MFCLPFNPLYLAPTLYSTLRTVLLSESFHDFFLPAIRHHSTIFYLVQPGFHRALFRKFLHSRVNLSTSFFRRQQDAASFLPFFLKSARSVPSSSFHGLIKSLIPVPRSLFEGCIDTITRGYIGTSPVFAPDSNSRPYITGARSTWEFQIYQRPRRMQIAHEARLIKRRTRPATRNFLSYAIRVARSS